MTRATRPTRPAPFLALAPGLALLLSACATLQPVEQNAAELAALPQAKTCEATLPFFGQYRPIGERLPMYAEPNGAIRMRNDGGWCVIRHPLVNNYTPAVGTAHVAQPPAHGQVIVGSLNRLFTIAYRPEPGFVGSDPFKVRLTNPFGETIPVAVTVLPP